MLNSLAIVFVHLQCQFIELIMQVSTLHTPPQVVMWTFLSSPGPNPVSCRLDTVLDCKSLTAKTQEIDVKMAFVLW